MNSLHVPPSSAPRNVGPAPPNGRSWIGRGRWWVVAFALAAWGIGAAVSCGGTTGQEGLPAIANPAATAGADAAVDSTVTDPVVDAGTFDVEIFYADRALPNVVVPVEGGEAGYPWPDCPPWVLVDALGYPVDSTNSVNLIPASFDSEGGVLLDDAGRVVPAQDGSPCATYPWLGTQALDTCVARASSLPYTIFPPCNWCADAGKAAAGPGAGHPLYDNCLALYACIVNSGCGGAADSFSVKACVCGDSGASECPQHPAGPCATEEFAAAQVNASDPAGVTTFLTKDLVNVGPGTAFCAGALNQVFQTTISVIPRHCPDAAPW
jgi:hypothetical protein